MACRFRVIRTWVSDLAREPIARARMTRRPSRHWSLRLVAATWIVMSEPASAQPFGGLFHVEGEEATRVVVTVGPDWEPPLRDESSPMLDQIDGVLARFEGTSLRQLQRCVPRDPAPIGRPPDGIAHCFLRVISPGGAKTLEVVRTEFRMYVVEEYGTGLDRPPRAELNATRWEELSKDWPLYRGTFEPFTGPRGEVTALAPPIRPGAITWNIETMSERIGGGAAWTQGAMDRVLSADPMHVRLPRGYDPLRPAGLLIWISPIDDGRPPEAFERTLDEHNVICVGVDHGGNARHRANRYQLAFDALATVQERYHVDPRRVYVTGMSGGGRIASDLAACAPEFFDGAVCLVGVHCFRNVPLGNGLYKPAGFAPPSGARAPLARRTPIAVITGRKDYNYDEIASAVRLFSRDGWTVRLFEDEDMAHEMPSPERFLAAFEWVDRASRQAASADAEAAARLLETYRRKYGDGAPESDAARALLVRVTGVGPWTEGAREALRLLRKAAP